MRTDTAKAILLSDYRAPDWLVERVDLDFSLHPTQTQVRATLRLTPNAGTPAPLVLDGDGLTLKSLKLDGKELAADNFVATADKLTIAQPPRGAFTLEIETLVDPTANTQLSGLYRSSKTYCTQCEAEGFRRITYFPDRPDVMAVYTTRIEADKAEAPVLLANGNLTDRGDLPGGRHFAVWEDPFKKPSYLFALVGGNLGVVEDTFTTMSGRKVALKIYVEPGKEKLCDYAMDSLKRSMRWDEEAFGREYDLDIFMIVAVSDFNMGAMENKGLNVFNDKLVLASPQSATDADYAAIEAVIAHEYFHNWTGNRITCRDWFQLCLKEGLTVFRDQEFSSDMRSRPVKRVADVRALRATQFVEDAGPLAHPVRPSQYKEINNFYTATIYEKGAEVVRMIKTLVGDDKFREGMNLYFERHDGEAATVEQFVKCFADMSKRDMSQFMRWYSQAGTPEVIASGTYDKAAQTFRLEIGQGVVPTPGQPNKEPMVIPLALGLVGKDGRDLPLRLKGEGDLHHGVLVLSKPADKFLFTGITEKPALSINRGFSAPVKLTANMSTEDLAFLAANDSDSFNRWHCVQALAIRALVERISKFPAGGVMRPAEGLFTALAALVTDEKIEPAFAALVLAMPSEADIAREIGANINPEAIWSARTDLRAALGAQLQPVLHKIYERMADNGPYSPDAASAGRRALRNIALDLMAATGEPDAIARAGKQYEAAGNMTDRLAALATLIQHAGPTRDAALDDFYQRYSDNPLIVDKWLTLQATAPDDGVLANVQSLTKHAAFAMTNPNRVRALIGAFAHSNQRQFNRADGKAYEFIADMVIALDPANPQVAARLATAFRSWRALESGRRAKAEAAMRRIKAASSLSRDVTDIVERSLGG
jgi:aminopeptidase N